MSPGGDDQQESFPATARTTAVSDTPCTDSTTTNNAGVVLSHEDEEDGLAHMRGHCTSAKNRSLTM